MGKFLAKLGLMLFFGGLLGLAFGYYGDPQLGVAVFLIFAVSLRKRVFS